MSRMLEHNNNSNQLQFSQNATVMPTATCLYIGVSFFSAFLLPNHAVATLLATTAHTIQGEAPYLQLTDGTLVTTTEQLVSFSMPDGKGGMVYIGPSQTDTIIAPKGMKYNDVQALVLADGKANSLSASLQIDPDGDLGTPSGTITASWITDSKQVTNLALPLSVCGGPYLLYIRADDVKAQTRFGDPSTTTYGSYPGKTYRFMASGPNICYIKPASTEVYTGRNATETKYPYQSAANPGGYNPTVWDYDNSLPTKRAHLGFSYSKMGIAGVTFPTVAFENAAFSLIGSGSDQSIYRCSTNSPYVTLSGSASSDLGQNCMVTYGATKPTSSIIINMEYTLDSGSTWQPVDRYTIAPPTKWATSPKSMLAYNTASDFSGTYLAAIACGADENLAGSANQSIASRYLFKRDEFTNSPIANEPLPTTSRGGAYSRDVDSTFMGEWGNVYTYANSPWTAREYYWTADKADDANQFYVVKGSVGYSNPTTNVLAVICRG